MSDPRTIKLTVMVRPELITFIKHVAATQEITPTRVIEDMLFLGKYAIKGINEGADTMKIYDYESDTGRCYSISYTERYTKRPL